MFGDGPSCLQNGWPIQRHPLHSSGRSLHVECGKSVAPARCKETQRGRERRKGEEGRRGGRRDERLLREVSSTQHLSSFPSLPPSLSFSLPPSLLPSLPLSPLPPSLPPSPRSPPSFPPYLTSRPPRGGEDTPCVFLCRSFQESSSHKEPSAQVAF